MRCGATGSSVGPKRCSIVTVEGSGAAVDVGASVVVGAADAADGAVVVGALVVTAASTVDSAAALVAELSASSSPPQAATPTPVIDTSATARHNRFRIRGLLFLTSDT
jgi:hypothetical protein